MQPSVSRLIRKSIASSLVVALFSLGISPARANAMAVPTQQLAPATAINPAQDMASVQAALENKVIRQHLNNMGLSDAEIDTLLARLSDDQLHQVALQIDEQRAAGDGGVIITVLVIAILLVVLIRLID